MAVQATLRSSTGSITFSQSDLPMSPGSPAGNKLLAMSTSSRSSADSHAQQYQQNFRNLSAQFMSPTSDIGPSPVTSNGTETTEIEDDEAEDSIGDQRNSQLIMLRTNLPSHIRQASSEEAVSVIHAPESFHSWMETNSGTTVQQGGDRVSGIISPPVSEAEDKTHQSQAPPPISTDVKPVKYNIDSATPQAQTLDDIFNDPSRRRSSSAGGLENIPESHESDLYNDHGYDDYITSPHMDGGGEIVALRAALEECWTLCNTLANLSSIHRERVFNSSGTPDAHEKAWKCCWKLCQRLYHSRDEASESFSVGTNLDLCRDFCQALFDVRQRKDPGADSVFRVCYELNNHLYSGQDWQNLPEPFKERTLDFYITLCHRLMKQRSELAEETDSLLRACWSLAEMLFSLRQNSRDGKAPDEELLGSAVQACWELCDIFREGWTQIRPDRGTPRPSQINFQQSLQQQPQMMDTASIMSSNSRVSNHSKRDSFPGLQDRPSSVASTRKLRSSQMQAQPLPTPQIPETPVTEFEDTPVSPESSSPQMPNIMVLGTSNSSSTDLSSRGSHGASSNGRQQWPSSASNLSGYSQGSNKTSSTATTATSAEDINVTRIKMLILKAAMNIGFSRDATATDGKAASKSLQAFVKSLPPGSFGSLPAHASLLQSYKSLVLADAFRASNSLPSRGRRVAASDAAKSVGWMMLRSNQYGFLRDLFKLVFSFPLEEAEGRKTSSIVV
ncbi:hypothetical protein CMQ_4143 [Grosmannia clavigera kw1407]|uniref:DUF7624 domain-containing protein n=1 Tax=Grosmannia clavigera (strain kw1407 / UAMH 11150) TaxID=655863 RepID=F0XAJ4_GROCL|nr:uncharacterized protein CMQ_4143 [Grosmannia clavigera kw1407]EFX06074.1 hypothetical protein CMQ_4143 [Grosmannia clavigera kw1407]